MDIDSIERSKVTNNCTYIAGCIIDRCPCCDPVICPVCLCVCLDGSVGDPGRHWPLASGGGALLCGGGDGGGHPELSQVCSQPLRSGKKLWLSSTHRALLCQIDTFRLISARRGDALRLDAPWRLHSSFNHDCDKIQSHRGILYFGRPCSPW